jgi:single stranded DNA-binding protein
MSGNLKVILMGAHIGGDAQNRFTPTGKQVISFSAASNRQYNSANGEPTKETTWLHCTVWPVSDAQAEFFMKNLIKGRKVSLEGRLAIDPQTGGPRLWTDNSGATRASYEVTVNPMTLDISNNGISNGLTTGEGLPAGDESVPF